MNVELTVPPKTKTPITFKADILHLKKTSALSMGEKISMSGH